MTTACRVCHSSCNDIAQLRLVGFEPRLAVRCAEVVEDLDRWPLEHGCATVRDLSEQDDVVT
jgi:hypothetical protein